MIIHSGIQKALTIGCVLLLTSAALPLLAQVSAQDQPPVEQAQQLLSPEQLDNLVAPVALYPDPLLGQVLAASTYPLEIAEAQQWLQQNSGLRDQQLIDAAQQQPWDPSVQAMVALPNAMALLSRDIRWTTDLGNAFLAQQGDVMAAVQRMRAQAENNGKLETTPQQVVTNNTQDGQSAIEIQPANPQVVYVPVYQPAYVWGAPAWDPWPSMWYPEIGYGFGFGPAVYIGSYYGGWSGWGGWGWGLNWYNRGVFLNTGFFNHYGYRGYGFGGGLGGRVGWVHDPGHRLGVGYSNRAVADRFRSSGSGFSRFSATRESASRYNTRSFNEGNRSGQVSRGETGRNFSNSGQQNSRPQNFRSAEPSQGYRSFSNSTSRSYSEPRAQNFSAQRHSAPPSSGYSGGGASSSPHYSAPQSRGGGSHYSGGSSGGGHSSGGGRRR